MVEQAEHATGALQAIKSLRYLRKIYIEAANYNDNVWTFAERLMHEMPMMETCYVSSRGHQFARWDWAENGWIAEEQGARSRIIFENWGVIP